MTNFADITNDPRDLERDRIERNKAFYPDLYTPIPKWTANDGTKFWEGPDGQPCPYPFRPDEDPTGYWERPGNPFSVDADGAGYDQSWERQDYE